MPGGKEVLVVGAGDAGGLVLREMLTTRLAGYTPIGLVDDDPRKRHMRLHGVKVLGTTHDLPRLLRERRPDEVHIAIPSAAGATRSRIVAACRTARVPVRTLPAVHELLDGDSNLLAPAARGAGRGRARPRPRAARPGGDRRLRARAASCS